MEVVVGLTTWVPDRALLPLQAPEAVQETIPFPDATDQVKVDCDPEVMEVGEAVNVRGGAVIDTVVDCEVEPLLLVQVKV